MGIERAPVIVVVEDEPDILDVLQITLALHGYVAIGFNHPYQLKTLDTQVDLFLVDVMLPTMNGIRVAQMLRDTGFRDTPMVAMSASDDKVRKAQASGLFNAAIEKPFDVNHLLDIIAWHLPNVNQPVMSRG